MSAVNETLQELVERRLLELGHRRGRGERISLHEAYERLPVGDNGRRSPSYETFRRIRELGHTNIGLKTARALATILEVDVDEVTAAAGQRPVLGPFELPARAEQLSKPERAVVLGVVDAILDAAQAGQRGRSGRTPGDRRPLRAVAQGGKTGDAEKVDKQAARARRRQSDTEG